MMHRNDRGSASNAGLWEPLLTPEEVASDLHKHVKTVVRMAREKKLPAIRLGRHWRFRASDLKTWADRKVQSDGQSDE
jgi:excisionase family DNA binding protein